MNSKHDKKRMNVEGDRLSNLSDDLIHKILAFIGTKHAIETSVLSSRWRYIWTTMRCLDFSSKDFRTLPEFSIFVAHVLSRRNNQIEVSSAKLTFSGSVSKLIVKKILDYAFSHKVQLLNITYLRGKEIEFPLSLFRSRSLKHLTLNGDIYEHSITTPPSWELPALATLNLHCLTLYGDNIDKCASLFFNCASLKNLTLKRCRQRGLNCFNICHPGLSSLTLEDGCHDINVITPQLKSLVINNCRRIHLISTPNLSSLRYTDDHRYYYNYYYDDDDLDPDDDDYDDVLLQLSTKLLHLENVDICINRLFEHEAYTRKIVCMLQQLHSVKFLTLNLELVKALSLSVELISHQPSPFVNLKSLKIYPADVSQPEPEVTMSTEVKNYLLDSSPGATLTMVSHDEIRAVMNVTSSRNLMREVQVLLDEWKENSETNTAHMKQDMSTLHEQVEVENHMAQPDMDVKWHFGERMTHIESYWGDLRKPFTKGYNNTHRTISLLRKIEGVLTKLPASRRAKLQARFLGLCAEAETMMDSMMDRMMIQCNKKPRRSNVFFHEHATSSHLSS